MTDQLEARLRGMLRDIDDGPMRCAILEADEIAEIADELARLRKRERRLEEALEKIMDVLPGGEAFHIALEAVCSDDTAAPAAEREG